MVRGRHPTQSAARAADSTNPNGWASGVKCVPSAAPCNRDSTIGCFRYHRWNHHPGRSGWGDVTRTQSRARQTLVRVSTRVVSGTEPFHMGVERRLRRSNETVGDSRERRCRKLQSGDRKDRQAKPAREVPHALQLYPVRCAAFHEPGRSG